MKYVFSLIIALFSLTLATHSIEVKRHPTISQKRLELTRDYAKKHYGINSYLMHEPKIIVIHYSVLPSLKSVLSLFSQDEINPQRSRLLSQGKVNVGVHYVVDYNGDIYSLLPTSIMGRHTIGFNHTSIGIENVGTGEDALTKEQIQANAKLIHYLTKKHPSITYLIGHMEYMNRTYPHFSLFLEKVEDYTPSIKIDPGWGFLKSLRKTLKDDYKIVLQK